MQIKRELISVWRIFVSLGIVAVALIAFVFTLAPLNPEMSGYWLVLPALALLSEFLPVELSRRGVRVTFTLPFVAGVAFAKGPFFAIATDMLVTLVAGYAMVRRRRSKTASLWLGINVFVGAISTCVGALAKVGLERSFTKYDGNAAVECVAFMLGYGLVNFFLVTYLDWRASGRPWSENMASTFRLSVKSFALYTVVGMAVAVLADQRLFTFIPFTIVPVLALRTALQYQAQMSEHYYETITALTLMLQRAHPYTHGHLERVAKAAEEVARRLGLSGSRARMVREAAVLHDIGKIAVDEALLDKPDKLTDDEMDHVRKHAAWGAEILAPVQGFKDILPWILHHHERPDGKGYPSALSDPQIPLESKIIAVVDAYDAMTGSEIPGAKRSYRDPMSVDEALEELKRCSGTQFDERVVSAFRSVVMEGRY
ncbi:MAG: HD-GYP domain-containing protein [Chlorobia bacterium]|nr:HD-GYP domain-containing protein [Fimbriimonadaceae bacterium]